MKDKILLTYRKGITHTPSDLLCDDGDLEECVNLEVKGQELVPMEMPVKLGLSLGSGERLVLVHNTKLNDRNYVVSNGDDIKILDGSSHRQLFSRSIGEVKSIQYIGNSIVIYTEDSHHYILYSGGSYKYLGEKIPEVSLSFDLNGEFAISDEFDISTPESDYTSDEYQERVVSQLIPEVNKFVEEKSVGRGQFMFPFFVRYALRMFDGTYTMHSAPILMLPSTNISPFVASYADMRNLSGKTFKAQIGGFTAKLEATIESGSLSSWSDIITSVDIFVSRQIYTYDQNGTHFGNAALSGSKFVGKYGIGRTSTVWDGYSQMVNNITLVSDEEQTYLHRWYIPSRDIGEITGEIESTSLFYKYTSLALDDISSGLTHTLSGVLSSIEVGEALTDDYMTHDSFIPESSFVYNGRLNISNIKRKLFEGFPVHSMTQIVKSATLDNFSYDLIYGRYQVYTYIKSPNGGEDIVVRSGTSIYGSLYSPYFFYPDSDAYKMVIVDTSNGRHSEIPLKEHALLNGAYYFGGFNTLGFTSGSGSVAVTDNVELQLNKLYVSNVNNLFHFPLEGIYTVGSDRIIGMSAVTRPISQGQFGEFPLIVFCSDGNYAMRVDEQGYYAAISPVQEDVVLGNDKITPMENSVVIITQKGIMLTAGGEMNRIASQADGGVTDIAALESVGTSVMSFSDMVSHSSDVTGFLSYVYGSRMAFDYASNRLIVYNPEKSYSYVYNFENDTVSKMVLPEGAGIVTSVIDYPDTIIQDSKGNLYSLYTKEDVSVKQTRQNGIAVTRPIKMGAALSMKAVKQIMNLATYKGDSYVRYNLYGSNDNKTYCRVSSRFGKPYKYYRIAIYTYILPKESVSGTALIVEPRRDHKLR